MVLGKTTVTVPRLIMPGHLSGPYWLLDDPNSQLMPEIVGLIGHASPQAICLGCGEDPPGEGTLVLYQPASLAQTEKLLERGIEPERISFMPLTTEYPWAPWVIWRNLQSRQDLRQNPRLFDACTHLLQFSPVSYWDRSNHYWNAYRPYLNEHQPLFDMVLGGLADEQSRRILNMVLRCEPTEMWEHFIDTIFTACDYLSHSIPFAGDTVLNLGVFSGPELPYFMTLVGENGIVHNVDPLGHDKFDDYVRSFVATCPGRAREVRIAAGQARGQVAVRIDGDGQMRPGGDLLVSVVPLDEYVEQENIESVNFIKIDIEGMEIEALFGMANTISRCRPTLAVSIYHTPEHLWRIPLMLMQGLKDYEFYIDQFSPLRSETILTAIPRELRGIAHGLNAAPAHHEDAARARAI
jgi:methyltransferase FkbM-like protein